MNTMKIALLAGGWSSEKGISLQSGQEVYEALDKAKYHAEILDPARQLETLIQSKNEIDLAFVLTHGNLGEDGCIQGVLNILGIPFVGSGVLSSAMAMNKKITKRVYEQAGLRTSRDVVLERSSNFSIEDITGRLGPETIVKPVSEGSSYGISLCQTKEDLERGIEGAFQYANEVIVEEYIEGQEITCCVLGNQQLETLPLIQIVPKPPSRIFDFKAKYDTAATDEICPAPLSDSLTEHAQSWAKKAHQALECSDWSRTDMIVRKGTIYLLETNTIPGMTKNSLFPLAARTVGLSLSDLLDRLISLCLERNSAQ